MSTVLFIRHGQAGTRDDYDQLSGLGREQARLLGEHLRREGYAFSRVLTGPLRRQQETAELAGLRAEVDPLWAEFDLDAVFVGIVPHLLRDDAGFGERYRRQVAVIESGDAQVHRTWTEVDGEVVRAWIEGRYAIETESWIEFRQRIERALDRLRAEPEEALIAVSTSAAPIGIALGLAHGLDPAAEMGLAGVMWNTGLTMMRTHGSRLSLVSFNSIPHLTDPAWRTVR